MNSKELIKRTLEFNKPPRIPRQLWLLPWAIENFPEQLKAIQSTFPDDIVHAPGFHKQHPKMSGNAFDVGTFIDEWGCVFENKQKGIIGEVKVPQIQSLSEIENLRPPVECFTIDNEKINSFCKNTDKFVLAGCCPRPFERLQFLRGTENSMMDLAIGDSEIKALIDKIHHFYTVEFQIWSQTNVDGMMFMDDWGSQKSLLISPELWRRHFKPLYADYVEIARSAGKKVFMHSDGYILDIIEDLIDIGVDAVNCQIFCMDVDKLGELGRGKITFWGEIDRQYLLPKGDKSEIIEAVKKIQKCLYADGGVIAQLEFGPGAKPANIITAFETWNQYGG
jgi:hypothetical protein